MQHADSQAEATSKCSLACCNAYFPSFVVSMLTVLPAFILSAVISCNGTSTADGLRARLFAVLRASRDCPIKKNV